MVEIRILTYNIHKGRRALSNRLILEELKAAMEATAADIVCLQEVQGAHSEITQPQFERLADSVWSHFAYAQNALTSRGHHGNAILSRFPIKSHKNNDVSWMKGASRSILHAEIEVPEIPLPLHVMNVHFGLFGIERDYQLKALFSHIEDSERDAPLIIAGDFNDWNMSLHKKIKKHTYLKEAAETISGAPVKTFPSLYPMLAVDRIYTRGLSPQNIDRPLNYEWADLSDHLPLVASLKYDL